MCPRFEAACAAPPPNRQLHRAKDKRIVNYLLFVLSIVKCTCELCLGTVLQERKFGICTVQRFAQDLKPSYLQDEVPTRRAVHVWCCGSSKFALFQTQPKTVASFHVYLHTCPIVLYTSRVTIFGAFAHVFRGRILMSQIDIGEFVFRE